MQFVWPPLSFITWKLHIPRNPSVPSKLGPLVAIKKERTRICDNNLTPEWNGPDGEMHVCYALLKPRCFRRKVSVCNWTVLAQAALQDAIDWEASATEILFAHSTEGWKSEIRVPAWSGFGRGLFSWPAGGWLPSYCVLIPLSCSLLLSLTPLSPLLFLWSHQSYRIRILLLRPHLILITY